MARVIGLLSILVMVSYAEKRCHIPFAAFPKTAPVLFHKDGTLVEPSSGGFTLSSGYTFVIGCPGNSNLLRDFALQFVHATCEKDDTFSSKGNYYTVSSFSCERTVTRKVHNTGRQCTGGQWREIGYPNEYNSIAPLIKVCYHEYEARTHYSVHILNGAAIPSREDITRPDGRPNWLSSEVSLPADIEKSYERVTELRTFRRIFGSDPLARTYINPTNTEYYLARGHLSPSADFTSLSSKRLTFYYINAVPQWQIINNGNWRILEEEVRKMAAYTERKYNVITGTHEILMLNNNRSVPVPIYLAENDREVHLARNLIPVPKYIWKIVEDPVTGEAIAFIVHNNPYLQVQEPDLCPNICAVPGNAWYYHQWRTPAKGLLYCCEVSSFVAAVRNVPSVISTGTISHFI